MNPAKPPKPGPTTPPPDRSPKPMRGTAKAPRKAAAKPRHLKGKAAKAPPSQRAAAARRAQAKAKASKIAKVGPARLAARKGPLPMVWDVPDPAPTPAPAPAILVSERKRGATAGKLVLVGLVVLGLAIMGVATQVSSAPNTGTIKVHDGPSADPDQRNEPHVTGDLYVEGFNMAEDSGGLFFFSWPPTGNGELVHETTWTADDGEPAFHFLAGPFELPCGHYRVGASNGPAEPEDFPGGMKKKTFWVECPDEEPEPEPECGEPGAPPCPPPECGEPGAPPCPPCGTDDTPPCPCGTEGQPPCPCGTEGEPPCPCGTEGEPPCPVPEPEPALECPADLVAEAQSDGSVLLGWTPAPGSDGTNVYRADGDGDFEYVTTTAAGVGTYLDETTVAGEGYAFMVTALFGNEESEGCDVVEVTAIPEFPTALGMGLATVGGLVALALAGRRKA